MFWTMRRTKYILNLLVTTPICNTPKPYGIRVYTTKYILNLLVTTPICNTPKPYRMGDRGTYILIPNPSDY